MIRTTLALVLLLASSVPVFAQDCRPYFFSTIGRAEGQPANDWAAVLESLPGRGFGVNPQPGQRQPSDANHFGITVMIDAGGHARGRVWLATDDFTENDGNRWFTHEYQVIADGPSHGSFVWAWQDKGGATPRPCVYAVPGPGTPPPTTPPPSSGLEEQLRDLKDRVALLEGQAVLEARVRELIEQALTGLAVRGRTSGGLFGSHSHEINLPVIKP